MKVGELLARASPGYLDAAVIKEQLDLPDFLSRRYGVTFRNGRAACLKAELHTHGDKNPSMMMSKNEMAVRCFAHDCLSGSADCFQVVQKMDGVDFLTAKKICAEFVGLKSAIQTKRRDMSKKNATVGNFHSPRGLSWREKAGRLETHALDLTLKANHTLALAQTLAPNQLPDTVFDKAVEGIGRAFRDRALAEMLEGTAFTIRDNALTKERNHVRVS